MAAVAYLGPVSRVSLTLDDGTVVLAQLPSLAADRLEIGQRVRVEIEPTPVLVVAG